MGGSLSCLVTSSVLALAPIMNDSACRQDPSPLASATTSYASYQIPSQTAFGGPTVPGPIPIPSFHSAPAAYHVHTGLLSVIPDKGSAPWCCGGGVDMSPAFAVRGIVLHTAAEPPSPT